MLALYFTQNPALEKILGLHYRGFQIVALVFTRPCKPRRSKKMAISPWVEKVGLEREESRDANRAPICCWCGRLPPRPQSRGRSLPASRMLGLGGKSLLFL